MKHFASKLLLGVTTLSLAAAATTVQSQNLKDSKIKHVLLISIDGMHAVDYKNCVTGIGNVNDGQPYCPNLAALGKDGVNYVAASTSKPSDSFPGLMSIVTGATPRTMGVYYDVAYDRSLDAPAETTGNGVQAGPCTPYGVPTGTTTEYEEGIDKDQTKLNGGNGASLTDGNETSIQPKRLPRNPAQGCAPVYPWNFVRTNTIFGVIHNAGGYVAWSDKHPAYSSVQGYNGKLDDFYSPEINSAVVPLPGYTTPLGEDCSSVLDPGSDITAWTNSFQNIRCYDTIKVKGILNQIDGKDHLGQRTTTVPVLFGMNFQAVSVGQKLVEGSSNLTGGYTDNEGTPGNPLLKEIEFADASIGDMVHELKSKGLYDSTLIIITAKHGQSPIDPHKYVSQLISGTSPATLLASYLPLSESPANPVGIGATEDDISLLWLADSSNTATAVGVLENNLAAAGIGEIYSGNAVTLNYNKPGLGPGLDPRTPDIIVTPNIGVTYSGSKKKLMEHGGFAHDDTNVMLLISNPTLIQPSTVHAAVETSQIAPTILSVLGLNPFSLDGVRLEHTATLPAIDFSKFTY